MTSSVVPLALSSGTTERMNGIIVEPSDARALQGVAGAIDPPPVQLNVLASDIRSAAGALIRRVRHESGTTLTWSQSLLLSALARLGQSTASALAVENGLRTQTVWTSLETLERRGLVARQRDDADRRSVLVTLTEQGHTELETDRNVRESWLVDVLLEDFTDAERELLADAAPILLRLASAPERSTD